MLPVRNVTAFAVACQCLTKNLTSSILNDIDTMTLIVLLILQRFWYTSCGYFLILYQNEVLKVMLGVFGLFFPTMNKKESSVPSKSRYEILEDGVEMCY